MKWLLRERVLQARKLIAGKVLVVAQCQRGADRRVSTEELRA